MLLVRSIAIVAVLAATSGCIFMPPCDCPPASVPFESGTFESIGGTPSGVVLDEPFAHGAEPKTLVVDRDSGQVTITWERDGLPVVETWRIVDER